MGFVDIDHATRAELLELPNRYADALNTNRVEGFVGSFAPDGVWDVSSSNPKWLARGRDAIAKLYEYLRGAHEWVFQVVYQSVILECSGECAKVRTYVGEYGNVSGVAVCSSLLCITMNASNTKVSGTFRTGSSMRSTTGLPTCWQIHSAIPRRETSVSRRQTRGRWPRPREIAWQSSRARRQA